MLGRLARVFTPAAILLIIGAGCGDQSDKAQRDAEARKNASSGASEDQQRKRFGNLSSDDLEVDAVDLNRDDQPDQWVYKSTKEHVRTERDMNFDGKVDLWQYLEGGDVIEEEMDLDLDGRVDVVAYYKDGVVTRKAMSVNFDDEFSIVKFYNKQGQLLRVERDQDGDGTPDLFEYYNSEGQRERVGWDQNQDGVPDEFDKLPQ